MLADIGIIVGVYTFIRLLLVLSPLQTEGDLGTWQIILRVGVVGGLALIGVSVLDLLANSVAASEFTAGFTGTTR